MGKFSDMRKKQLEARGAAPSVRPPAAAPQVEPIAPAQQPVAPAAPVAEPKAPATKEAPAQTPAPAPVAPAVPVAPAAPVLPTVPSGAPATPAAPVVVPGPAPVPHEVAPVALPPIPSTASPQPSPKAASPLPATAAAGESSAEFEPIGSGDVLGEVSSSGPQFAAPQPALQPSSEGPDLFGDMLPPEAEPSLPPVPVPSAAPAVSSAPSAAVASARPAPVPVQTRKVAGTLGFAQPGDNAMIALGYKLQFRAPTPNSCFFSLIVKNAEWPELLNLELDTPKRVEIPTKKGTVAITFTYKGANDIGQKQVDYVMEGGVEAVTSVKEGFRKTGGVLRSAMTKFVQHLPEVIVAGFAVGLAACGFTMGWIKTQLGVLHPYVTVAVPLVIAAMATWAGFAREKQIKKEMEGSD